MLDSGVVPGSTVADLLGRHPETARVFRQLRTACVGCYLARFCTLTEVADVYGLETASLLAQIDQALERAEQT